MAVFLLLLWWGQLFSPQIAIKETYYVDVVNMPVAAPKAGEAAAPPVAPAPPATASPPLPAVPSSLKVAPKSSKFVKPPPPKETAESESAFKERMSKLSEKAEAQQYEERMKRIANRVKSNSNPKIGAPGATGAEAGSRYGDFIKSRLEDALKLTSSYTTKKPEVAVRLAISAEGKLLRMQIERSSGDATFELAVRRAIDLASEKFTAPPNGAVFENGFVFKPKGISNSLQR
jgi:colicin import membrane protein